MAAIKMFKKPPARDKKQRRERSLSAELLEIGKRCAAHVKRPTKSSDHAKMLYGRDGLPGRERNRKRKSQSGALSIQQ